MATFGNIEQAQICAEGCEGDNLTQILCKYCTNNKKLKKYLTDIVQILYEYCSNIVQISRNYYTTTE